MTNEAGNVPRSRFSTTVFGCFLERDPQGRLRTVVENFELRPGAEGHEFVIEHGTQEAVDSSWWRARCEMVDKHVGKVAGSCIYRKEDSEVQGAALVAHVAGKLLVGRLAHDDEGFESPKPVVFGPEREAALRRFRKERRAYEHTLSSPYSQPA